MEVEDKGKKTIMVAIDSSKCNRHMLQWALQNLNGMLPSSRLIVFTAVYLDLSGIYTGSYAFVSIELVSTIQDNQNFFADARLEKAKEVCSKYGIEADIVSVMGNPGKAIFDAVQKHHCDLLVVGSHGRDAIQRAFVGSVSNYCLHNAKCPVLVVRQPA